MIRLLLVFLVVTSCGTDTPPPTTVNVKNSSAGSSVTKTETVTETATSTDINYCSIKPQEDGTKIISCPDGSSTETEEETPIITEGFYCGRPVQIINKKYYLSLTTGLHHLQPTVKVKVSTTCAVLLGDKNILTEVAP